MFLFTLLVTVAVHVFMLPANICLTIVMGYSHFRVASWNVNGLNNPVKRSRVMTKMRRENSQIIFLQETQLSQKEELQYC